VATEWAACQEKDGASQAWLRVLGPVQVREARGWQSPPGPQLRLLMAFLALSSGQVAPAGDLVDLLWGEQPPPSARASLQILVSRLRKTLAGVPDCLPERYGDGYLLQLGPGLVDVHRFRSLVSAARAAPDSGTAVATFDQALLLWQGPALADVPDSPRVGAIRAALAEEHLSAVLGRFSSLLAAGRAADAAEEIPLVLARYPLAEQLAGILMTARYRCGRPADALQVFRDLRRRLAAELGVEPGPDLQRLHQRILSGDPALAMPGRPAAGDVIPLVPRRHLAVPQQNGAAPGNGAVPGNGAAAVVARQLPAAGAVVPRQLPGAPAHFAGRQRELRMLTERLDHGLAAAETVILTITGTAGVGKTALALHWAHQIQARFRDGQLYVNLHGFDSSPAALTPGEAVSGLVESLDPAAGRASSRLDAQAGLYRSLLAGRRMLIVLDNARDETQIRPLLPGTATCVVVVTSRSQLAGLVAAEGASPLPLDVLGTAEARQLLASRLGTERVTAEAREITELTTLCAGLPLALAITAARAAVQPSLPLSALTAGLRDIRRRLDELSAGDQAADVRAVLSWSCRLLSEPAARMFRLLGAHPGPDISAAAAGSLAAAGRSGARAALAELVRANLIQEHTPGRYTLHGLLRAYAADLCDEAERRAAIRRVLDHYLHTARAATGLAYPRARQLTALPPAEEPPEDLATAEQALDWLQAEYPVLLAAASAAASSGCESHAWQLPAVLREHFARRGHCQDWVQSQRRALAAAIRLGDRAVQALAGRLLGEALAQLGSPDEAHGHVAAALELYRLLGDHAGQACCHLGTARIRELRGELRPALHHSRRALSLYRTAGILAGQADALNAVGWYSALLGDSQDALRYCGQALELHRETGNRFEEATTLDSLGYCCHQAGHHAQAAAYYRQALRAYADAGDRYYRAQTLIHLGETQHASGHRRAGRDAWLQALAILDDLHHPDARPVRARLRAAGA
jgi:DNA-binding SARP family transcriptional activator/tetratricopeptide (TPR) repeat protein